MKTIAKKCAIYTRKSTDEGLDNDFNTLDAQRESCKSYIASQRSEGWKTIPTHYNDGGFSGGNMDRPALQSLLTDIKAGNVDIVVVYKIDRLTRSLMDFSKLVEVFDAHEVTFVSVTQSFNTTTSMGRLTLNVLLSFAQFEREVSAERIRDKIAASKKKGMWMGGNVPLGYDVENRKLLINSQDAETIHFIFRYYLKEGCVTKLKEKLDLKNITSKKRISKRGNEIGGKPLSRGTLYSILKNPIYIGKIRHKDEIHEGLHEGVISQELWDRVQQKLILQAVAHRGHKKKTHKNLLKGLLFDCDDIPYSPIFTNKKGRQYRYYVSQNLIQYKDHPKGVMARMPAHGVEKVIGDAVKENCVEALGLSTMKDKAEIDYLEEHISASADLVKTSVRKVVVEKEMLHIDINIEKLKQYLNDKLSLDIRLKNNQSHIISVPFTTHRSYQGAVVIKPKCDESDPFDLPPYQLKNLIRGVVWRDEHFNGMTMKDIAIREGMSKAGVQKIIMGSFDRLTLL